MPRRLLVTGFGPFADVPYNPSGALARALDGPHVRGLELPVSFRRAEARLRELLDAPEAAGYVAVLSLGVHPGPGFRLERRARPVQAADRVDVDGVPARALGLAGQPARENPLNLGALRARVSACSPVACELSDDAGGYVCEHLYGCLLRETQRLGVPAAFLHVPPADQVSVADQLPAVRALAEALVARAGVPRALRA